MRWDPNLDGVIIYCSAPTSPTYQNSFAARPCVIGLIKVVHEPQILTSNNSLMHGADDEVVMRCHVQGMSPYSCSYIWICNHSDVVQGCYGDLDTIHVRVNSTSTTKKGQIVTVHCSVYCAENFSRNATAVLNILTNTSKGSQETIVSICDNPSDSNVPRPSPPITIGHQDHLMNSSSSNGADCEHCSSVFKHFVILLGLVFGCQILMSINYIVYKCYKQRIKKEKRNLFVRNGVGDDANYENAIALDAVSEGHEDNPDYDLIPPTAATLTFREINPVAREEDGGVPSYENVQKIGQDDLLEHDHDYEKLPCDTIEAVDETEEQYEKIRVPEKPIEHSSITAEVVLDVAHAQLPPVPAIKSCPDLQQSHATAIDRSSSSSPSLPSFSSSSPHLVL